MMQMHPRFIDMNNASFICLFSLFREGGGGESVLLECVES